MNFLSSYGDDSDSDCSSGNNQIEENSKTITNSSNTNTIRTSSSTSNVITTNQMVKTPDSLTSTLINTKKKKLDISILPKHIQDALNSGITNDSDSDDDIDSKPLIKSISMIKGKSLISQLPKPKEQVELQQKKPQIIHYTPDADNSAGSNSLHSNNSDNSSSSTKIGYQATPIASITTAPLVRANTSTNDYNTNNTDNSNSNMDSHFYSHSHLTNNNNYNNNYNYEYSEESNTNTNTTSNSHKNKRKFESELMSGNIELLDTLDGNRNSNSNIHVSPNITTAPINQWNSNTYMMQQEKEMELKKSFGLGSKVNSNMAMAPTKQQNRKHQINSLAVAAVNMELSMLEAQGKRNVSKAQTQGKYGW